MIRLIQPSDLLWRISDIYSKTLNEDYSQYHRPHEFYTSEFIENNTQFASFDEFSRQSPWSIDTWRDLDQVPQNELNYFVSETTRFESWEQMRVQGAVRNIVDRHTVG